MDSNNSDSINKSETIKTEPLNGNNNKIEPTNDNNVDKIVSSAVNNNNADNMEQCNICGQFLNNSDIIYYQGHPQDAVEEYIALTNEKLVLSAGIFHLGIIRESR